jgi:transcriptional regulator with XRE-family HTH domain
MLVFLKTLRNNLGISQVKLAYESKVSLPTIQNIEAQKANPTLDVLEKLFQTLGLELVVRPIPINIELAIALGVPLTSSVALNTHFTPSKSALITEAKKWNYALIDPHLSEREKLAIISLIMALKDHYPTFYHQEICFPTFEEKIAEHRANSSVIKLRRISLSNLSKYL